MINWQTWNGFCYGCISFTTIDFDFVVFALDDFCKVELALNVC